MTAVIFDLDGVLVDSFAFWLVLMNDCARASGHREIDADALARSWGQSGREDQAEFFPDWTVEQVTRHYDARMTAYAGSLAPRTETVDRARSIQRQGGRIGVLTNSSRAFTDLALLRCALTPDVVVTVDDVQQPKPHPEGLLVACRLLDTPAPAALFVGDSACDAEAARAAGVPFQLVGSPLPGACR
ncbi:HAD-IA family hydrolase [Micromonospora sp. NPDC048170]|uniref:HAD family hydrolase n=1 Tax=Micromonospora sp. NPDC048170 TaxID=3154819 RepID=UPI003404F85E